MHPSDNWNQISLIVIKCHFTVYTYVIFICSYLLHLFLNQAKLPFSHPACTNSRIAELFLSVDDPIGQQGMKVTSKTCPYEPSPMRVLTWISSALTHLPLSVRAHTTSKLERKCALLFCVRGVCWKLRSTGLCLVSNRSDFIIVSAMLWMHLRKRAAVNQIQNYEINLKLERSENWAWLSIRHISHSSWDKRDKCFALFAVFPPVRKSNRWYSDTNLGFISLKVWIQPTSKALIIIMYCSLTLHNNWGRDTSKQSIKSILAE